MGGLELSLEGEAGGECIGALGVGNCSEELHAAVGREGVVEGDCESFGDGRGEEEADVSDVARCGNVGVIDATGLLEIGDDWLAGHQQRKGQTCHHYYNSKKQLLAIAQSNIKAFPNGSRSCPSKRFPFLCSPTSPSCSAPCCCSWVVSLATP